jgi:hypothetical protein
MTIGYRDLQGRDGRAQRFDPWIGASLEQHAHNL